MLFSCRRKHWQGRAKGRFGVWIGDQRVRFARESTRWLGRMLDAALTLQENRHRCLNRARQAEARLRRLVSKYGVPPESARNFQQSIVRGTLLYAAELTRSGEGEYQATINRMGRATNRIRQTTLSAFRSTPLGIVAAESGLRAGDRVEGQQRGRSRSFP